MKALSLLLAIALLLTGCETRTLYDAAGAGAGGLIADKLSNGNPLITAAGAAGGALVTDVAQQQIENGKDKAAKDAYNKGRSDAVKQQYWIVQNLQKNLHTTPEPRVSYYPITTGGATTNGITTVPVTEYVRVEDSR